jgi:hypothetical protein
MMVMMEFTKWGGTRHWHYELEELGADVYGKWFSGRPGTALQRGEDPPILELDGFVKLVPASGDWIAIWRSAGDIAIYVDVTNTPQTSGSRIEAIDLDLDVVAFRDGRVEVIDVDEFDEHRLTLGYPAQIVAGALATATWLSEHISMNTPPFDGTGPSWLANATATWWS